MPQAIMSAILLQSGLTPKSHDRRGRSAAAGAAEETMAAEQRHFDGGVEQIGRVRGWFGERLGQAGVESADIDAVLLALTEAYTNVLRHAYEGKLPAPLDVELEIAPDAVFVALRDQGKAFQPTGVTEPEPEELAEGGYGLFLIASLMDEVSYAPADPAGTVLRMKKLRATARR